MGSNQEAQTRQIKKVFEAATARGVELWLMGGWAIDAQLAGPGRRHGDIDVAVLDGQLHEFRSLLANLEYGLVESRQSNYRPVGQYGDVRVEGAALRPDGHAYLLSVPHDGKDAWLRLRSEWFPQSNQQIVGSALVRCARPEALLASKLSSLRVPLRLITKLLYLDDCTRLIKHIAPTEGLAHELERVSEPVFDGAGQS